MIFLANPDLIHRIRIFSGVFFFCFLSAGVEAAAVACERPFQDQANHLPFDQFAKVVAENVRSWRGSVGKGGDGIGMGWDGMFFFLGAWLDIKWSYFQTVDIGGASAKEPLQKIGGGVLGIIELSGFWGISH